MNEVSKQHEFALPASRSSVLGALCLAVCLSASLTACVVAPPQPYHEAPAVDPRQAAFHRFEQVQTRIQNMHRRVDHNVEAGYYPPPVGGNLHHRLEDIGHETQSMAQHHGGGLSREDQAVANRQLDDLGQEIH